MEVAKSFILPFITEGKHAEADYKTRLQEIVQQNPEERLSYVVAVSYTHLFGGHHGSQSRALDALEGAHDQACAHMQRTGAAGGNKGIALAAVAYTHLDVYKRQVGDHDELGLVAHPA